MAAEQVDCVAGRGWQEGHHCQGDGQRLFQGQACTISSVNIKLLTIFDDWLGDIIQAFTSLSGKNKE